MGESVTIEIRGADTLVRTLAAAAKDLDDMSSEAAAAASLGAAAARGLTPVRTGALRGSIRSSGRGNVGLITAGHGLGYGRPVHWGTPTLPARPFLSQGAQAAESIWVRGYEQHIRDALSKVKGT